MPGEERAGTKLEQQEQQQPQEHWEDHEPIKQDHGDVRHEVGTQDSESEGRDPKGE